MLDVSEWIMVILAAFIIGLGKAGVKGLDMFTVTLMAIAFGGKSSTGIVLPLLCLADIAAVSYYNRHAQWKYFRKLVPWMVVGILFGVFIGKDMDEAIFRKVMAVIVLLTILIVLVMEYRPSKKVPEGSFFVVATGISAGFTTMIGNLAGAFANLYFLGMQVPKNAFIGTSAWIFLCMNLFKLPFQLFYWENINMATLKIDAWLIPAVAIGFVIGIRIVKRVEDGQYRKLVILLTLAGSLMMLLKR